MSDNSATKAFDDSGRQQLLESVIADYIRACDAGAAPDQRRILEQHPDLADDLREFFAQRDHLNQLAGPMRAFGDSLFQSVGPGKHISYVGDYELLEEVARGGMGVVYKARQKTLGRIVAVKMMLTGRLANEDDVKRFQIEAQAAASLQHPNIVPIHEVGQHEGLHYFSMDFVEGRSLASVLRENVLPPKTAANIVRVIAEAIHYAHQQGTLHRDLKPSNVIMARSSRIHAAEAGSRPDESGHYEPRITDFGLAMRVEGDSGLTQTGQIVGTPSYMPPEQAQGKRSLIGPGSDVYSLGAILYECLTGRAPFRADSVMKTIEQVIHREAASPRLLNPSVARDLETICLKCLEKEPHRRYGTAQLLADDLGRYLDDHPILARPVGTIERTWRWCRRNPTVASLLATVALCMIVGTAVSSYFAIEASNRAKAEVFHRGRADDKAALAEQRRKEADDNAKLARRRLYVSHMNFAQVAWEENRIETVLELLEYDRPRPGAEDLRGFEWYYWNRLCHGERLELKGHTSGVNCVGFSPDGTRIATASSDRTIKVWDATTGHEVLTLTPKEYRGNLYCVAFSPNGMQVAGGGGRIVKLWDAITGNVLMTIMPRLVSRLAFSPDGTRLATTDSGEKTLTLWDVTTGQEVLMISTHSDSARGDDFAFSPDGMRIASADGTIWDVLTGKKIASLKPDSSNLSVAYSPDGLRIATGHFFGMVTLWDALTGVRIRELNGHTHRCVGVAFSPDGTQLGSASWDKTVKLWDIATGQVKRSFKGHAAFVSGLAFSPDGLRIASSSYDKTVKVWDVATDQDQFTLKGEIKPAVCVAFSPDGKQFVTANTDQSVTIWNAVTGQKTITIKPHTLQIPRLTFSSDGKRIASGINGRSLKLWSTATGNEMIPPITEFEYGVEGVSFNPDLTLIASRMKDGVVRLWDAATGREMLTLGGIANWHGNDAFHPDGKQFACWMSDQTVKLWDTRTGRETHALEGRTKSVSSLVFNPDGTQLALVVNIPAGASHDSSVKLWDIATGKLTHTLKGHTDRINCVVFSQDGTRLVSGCEDHTLKLWDVNTGQETLTFRDTNPIRSVAINPDGTRIASVNASGTITFWNAPRDEIH